MSRVEASAPRVFAWGPAATVVLASLFVPALSEAAPFTYDPPGTLVPASSGQGRADTRVYEPTMRFPMESAEAFANSQVHGHGGGSGPSGTSQCDQENFSYPWHDNYCEVRSWSMPLCPSGTGHQGQDIRGATCVKNVHPVVAAEDGTITNVGSYSVYLTTAAGTRFDYLHMGSVAVTPGEVVRRGDLLGKVSNQFGGTPTTVHLHLNIRQTIAGVGTVFVPPYTSLIESYQRLLGVAPALDASLPVDAATDGPSTDAAGEVDAGRPFGEKENGEVCSDGAECRTGRCFEVCVWDCHPEDPDLFCEADTVCADVSGGMGCIPAPAPGGCACSIAARGAEPRPIVLALALLLVALALTLRRARHRC